MLNAKMMAQQSTNLTQQNDTDENPIIKILIKKNDNGIHVEWSVEQTTSHKCVCGWVGVGSASSITNEL